MKRGFGLGEKFAREKFELCWRDFATDEEIEFLSYVHGGAWSAMYPRPNWNEFLSYEPSHEDYLEFIVSIYPSEKPHSLARFLVPRDESNNTGFLIWNHYQGSTIFQEI